MSEPTRRVIRGVLASLLLWNGALMVAPALAVSTPATAAPRSGSALSLSVRQRLFKELMAIEVALARQFDDPLILKGLQREGDVKARQQGQASLSCALMERMDVVEARRKPQRDRKFAALAQKYRVTRSVLDAVLKEGQDKAWAF